MSRQVEVISHWHHSLEAFNTSALEFYQSVEKALQAKEARSVRTERVEWGESGILSAKREYLRVSYGRYSFDLCAAPFGTDFFFSWWLVKRQPNSSLMLGCLGLMALPVALVIFTKAFGIVTGTFFLLLALGGGVIWMMNAAQSGMEAVEDAILSVPVIGYLYARFLRPVTYYSEDSRLMFEEAVHRVVIDQVAALLNAKGVRALAPEEKKPQSRNALR